MVRLRPGLLLVCLLFGAAGLHRVRGAEASGENRKPGSEAERQLAAGRFREAVRLFREARRTGGDAEKLNRRIELCELLDDAKGFLKAMLLKEAKEAINRADGIDAGSDAACKPLGQLRADLKRYDTLIAQHDGLPGKFSVRSTRHFRIHHHHPYLASDVAAAAEKHLAALVESVGYEGVKRPRFSRKLHIYLYRDQQDYVKNTDADGRMFSSMATSDTEIVTTQRQAMGALKHETTSSKTASFVRLLVGRNRATPLAEFIDLTRAGMNRVDRHAQCWALFHFLQHGQDGKYRRDFHRYLAEVVRTGQGGVATFEKFLGPVAGLEPLFQLHTSGLRPTSKKR